MNFEPKFDFLIFASNVIFFRLESKIELTEVFIETTSYCNLGCVFCPYSDMTRKKENMPTDKVIWLIDELHKHTTFDWISLHLYGEPLIHPDFVKIARYASVNKQMNVNVTTNGVLLTSQIMESLLQAGIWKIILSIQAPPDLFEVRRSKTLNSVEYHNKIEELITSFITLREKYNNSMMELHYLDTALFKPAVKLINGREDFQQIIDYWRGRLISKYSTLLYNKPVVNEDEGSGILYEILPGLSFRLKPAISFGNAVKSPDVSREDAEKRCYTGYCQFSFNSIVVLANGDIVSCCLDYNGENVLGNVFEEGSLMNVYNSDRARLFRQQFVNGRVSSERCQRCLGGVFFGSAI